MIVQELLRRYRMGELSEAELCSMIAERAHLIDSATIESFTRQEPALASMLLRWLAYVASGQEIVSSEGAVRVPVRARFAARSLLRLLTAAVPHVRGLAAVDLRGLRRHDAGIAALSGDPLRPRIASVR